MTDAADALPWRQLAQELRAFVARRVGSGPVADDIVQDVLLRAHEGLSELRDDQLLVPWLYRIARNAVIDHYRTQARRSSGPLPSVDLFVGHQDGEIDVGDATRAELARCVAPLLETLPAKYREAILLTEYQGLTQSEAAARLGLSVSGMKSRVQRARAKLLAAFTRCCEINLDARNRPIDASPRT